MSVTTAGEIGRSRPEPSLKLAGAAMVVASVVLGLTAGALATNGQAAAVFGLAAIVVLVFAWRQPALSPIIVLVAALTVEQFPFEAGQPGSTSAAPTPSDYTDRIPLFRGLAHGVHVSLADVLLVTLLTFWLLKRGTSGAAAIPRTAVTACVGAVIAAVLVGIAVGQAHHGELRTAFTEVRPYVYLALAFLLASVFATRERIIRMALWAFVLGSGFKSIQAIHSFMTVRHQIPRPDFVVGHEEALFFSLFIVLTALLWIFEIPGRLRTTATCLFPLVLVADLVNSRRAAWLILGGMVIALTIITMVAVPARRRFMSRALAVMVVVSVFYFPAYWNHTGALAGPARAVQSAVAPNTRDELSDLYRVQENANLKANIRDGGALGNGFGVPIDYRLPITDISSIDPLIKFIPHNGVLYLFMRLGLLGAIAFWCLIGAGIINGCRLARSANREVALFGALIACALVGYALEGYNDQGFFLYRVALVIGTLLGLGEGLRRLEQRGLTFSVAADPVPVAVHAPPITAPAPVERTRKPEPVARTIGDERWDRVARLGALVLLPFALGLFVWLLVYGNKQDTAAPRAVQKVAAASVHDPRPTPSKPAAEDTRPARLELVGTRKDTWAEVRRDSAAGPVLFSGIVHPDERVTAEATRLWVRFGGAANLEITLNGRRLPFTGTVETTLTSRFGVEPKT
jgi:hypothetical protein